MANAWMVALYLVLFLIILGLLIVASRRARAQAAAVATPAENPHEAWLLRFITREDGTRVGETVAVEGAEFIVKDAKGFLAIPTALVKEEGQELRLTGTFDEASARQKGEAWRERSHKVITYSDSEIP